MEIVAGIVVPVFGIVILGYLAAKSGYFPESALGGLSKFAFAVAIPIMLFHKLATLELPDQISWHLLGGYYGVILLQWVIAMSIGRHVFGRPAAANAILGMGSAFGNLVALGLPLTVLAYGEAGTLPLFMIIGVHSTIQFTIVSLLMERARSDASGLELIKRTLKGSLGNPIVIGLLSGSACNFVGLRLPEMLDTMLSTIGNTALPTAVFAMGAALAKYSLKGNLGVAAVMTGLKLLWLPFAVYWVCTGLGISAEWRAVATLLAGMPTGVNVFLFAETYQSGQASAASGILVSSFLSIFTLSGILLLTAP